MVDWQNPVTVLQEFGALIKVVHVINGIYIWEFITNLGFEWGLFQGRRHWRWTVALYIATRMTTMFAVITDLVGLNTYTHFVTLFRYATTSFALSLYAIRGIAIWQRSLAVTIISVGIVLANVGVWVRRVIKANSIWSPVAQSCLRVHTHTALVNNGVLLASEVFFILLMAGGIYLRNPGPRAFKIMYREGLTWLVIATLVQTPPVVFLILNLNDVMNIIFIAPSGNNYFVPAPQFNVLTVLLCHFPKSSSRKLALVPQLFCSISHHFPNQRSIGATRMYRTLSDRQAGNLLDFWETSRDETTGEIRFRRQTQLVARHDGQGASDTASTTALPMGRLVRTQPQVEERYVERFEARDIELDDDSESMRDAKPSIGIEDDKTADWVHAK
ncbi:hypothetical protein BC827DRAFT_1269365 [Russula dissimulans]|nr:hypothetical protein BC827DRAFT_1269365 [Russula dissimulans]